jgi:chromosome segregation ATPase
LETARAELDRMREELIHHTEDRARLVAGNQEWQEQIDAVRNEHHQERRAFQEEAGQLREERDHAAALVEQTIRERDRLAGERSDLATKLQDVQSVLDSTREQLRENTTEVESLRSALELARQETTHQDRFVGERLSQEQTRSSEIQQELQKQLDELRLKNEEERDRLLGELNTATLQAADFARQRDENLAGWEAAATYAHSTEDRAREEVDKITGELNRTEQELAAIRRQQNEASQRAQSLQGDLERQRELVASLTRELEDARERSLAERPNETAHESDPTRESELVHLRAELSEIRGRLTAMEKEREELRAESERLRSDRTPAAATPPVLTRRYEELQARIEALRVVVEESQGRTAAPVKGGLFSRLMGRGAQPKVADTVPLGRRMDTLRVDVAVERERALRVTAEAARTHAERQLADALAMLRERGEVTRRQAQRPEDPIVVPYGAKAP